MVPQRICQHTGFPVCQLCPCQSMLQYAAIMKSVFTPLLMLPAWRWYLQVARWPGVGDLRKSSSLDLLMSHMEMLYGFLRVFEWHSNIFIGFSFPLRFNRLKSYKSSTVELLNCCVPTGLDDRWPGWTAGWKYPEPRYDGQWRNGKQHGLGWLGDPAATRNELSKCRQCRLFKWLFKRLFTSIHNLKWFVSSSRLPSLWAFKFTSLDGTLNTKKMVEAEWKCDEPLV